MTKIITKELFIKIFENENYRQKLDKIILNFFGLENYREENSSFIPNHDITLEIILFINTEYLLKIIVKDTKNLFQQSHKFYLNISYQCVDKYFVLLIPCYWEIYCQYSLRYLKNKPKLILIAALFACKDMKDISKILSKLKVFQKSEITDILNKIKVFSKDK